MHEQMGIFNVIDKYSATYFEKIYFNFKWKNYAESRSTIHCHGINELPTKLAKHVFNQDLVSTQEERNRKDLTNKIDY